MKLTLQRTHGTEGYTHGKLFIDDEYFCDTMEDQERDIKVAGKTAIPLGHYRVILDMSARFKQLMPQILNVPNYAGVRIHFGNTAADTEGCVLVGKPYKDDFITASKETFKNLMGVLLDATHSGQVITIEIT